jgi:hypothetical protein
MTATDSPAKKRKTSYPNPLPGKPVPLELSGLFLWDPSISLKLMGLSLSSLFKEQGKESLYKRIVDVKKGKRAAEPNFIKELLAALPQEVPFRCRGKESVKEGETKSFPFEDRGLWEAFLLSGAWDASTLHNAHLLSIESASKQPESMIREGRFSDAARFIEDHPLLRELCSPTTLTQLSILSGPEGIPQIQAAFVLEAQLSLLAASDVQFGNSRNESADSHLSSILPSPNCPGKNASSLFFEWFKKETGVGSVPALLRHPKATEISLDEVTLKNWNRGKHFPSALQTELLAQAFFGDKNYKPAWFRYHNAKTLNLMGYLAQRCVDRACELIGTPQEGKLAPWPCLPFGQPDFATWCQMRYPYWINFHKSSTPLKRH